MCGLAGIIHFDQQKVNEQQLTNMGNAIRHRGPDDNRIWSNGNIGFAHQRLSIIDTSSAGQQPMHSKDGRYTIVYNGELYNHLSFRSELLQKGFTFHSNSDTEVLLYLYIAYGPDVLHRLNGMFAFAIWDNLKQELFICRDRMGIKPLYYHSTRQSFYFASEPKAIFAAGVKKEIDEQNTNEWLLFRYIAGEESILKGIKKILPGCYSIIKIDGSIHTTRWYHLGNRIQQHAPITNPKQWFEETFHNAVKTRMLADVPVGILLSGGLDSSSIAASLHHSGFRNIHTFNIGFHNYIHDESTIAGNFSKQLNFPFHSIKVEGDVLFNALQTSIYHLDEPLIHTNDPQMVAISQYAKKHVSVLLSGEGADEIMGGYIRYKTFKWINYRRQISFILKYTPERFKDKRIKKLERYLKAGGLRQLIVSNASNNFECDFDALGLQYLGINNPYRANVLEEAKKTYPNNPMRQLLYYDQHTYLQSLNERNDRATMAASIECREPFQDYRLIEGIGTLGLDWLTKGKKGKHILLETMKPYLPDAITHFRKVGLAVPWMKLINENEQLSNQWNTFKHNPSLQNELLDKVNLKPIIAQMDKGIYTEYDSLVFQYFMYHIWMNSYLQTDSYIA